MRSFQLGFVLLTVIAPSLVTGEITLRRRRQVLDVFSGEVVNAEVVDAIASVSRAEVRDRESVRGLFIKKISTKTGKTPHNKESKKMKGSKSSKCGHFFGGYGCGSFSFSMPSPPSPSAPSVPTPTRPTPSKAPIPSKAPVPSKAPIPSKAPTPTAPVPGFPTTSPFRECNSLPRDVAFLRILDEVTPEAQLLDQATPQGMAYVWIISEDPLQVSPCTYPTVEQRYALATFYYSTIGPQWTNQGNWLSGEPECQWTNIRCSSDSLVTALIQSKF